MEKAKVIEFPKSQSFRKRMQDKAQEQKSAVVLSIASILIMTLFLNQWIVEKSESELTSGGTRKVASFEPAVFARDVKWEHELAKKLSSEENGLLASLGEKPTLRDDLIFGYLEGKYGMKLADGRVESLEFIDAQAGDKPLTIENKAEFLMKYSDAFGRGYAEVSSTKSEGQEEVYNLIDSTKTIVGQAHFGLDSEGRVQSLKFTR